MDPSVNGSLGPSYTRRNQPPFMDPQSIGAVNAPAVYVPRGFVPEFNANYTPQPTPPWCEEEPRHVPGPSVAYNIAHQQNVSSSNLIPPGVPISRGLSMPAAYSPSPYHQLPPWFRPPDFLYAGDLLGRPLTPSLGPPFLHRKLWEWGIDFYIRVDHAGRYHTYPYVGGPFEGLREVGHAIKHYLDGRRDPKMSTKDNVSAVDINVKHYLYWPDGTRKRCSRTEPVDETRDSQLQLAHALVDKYNEDNNILGDHAYELIKVECYLSFCEGDVRMRYKHINFTAKAKGAVYCEVFFAEVISMQGEELPVSCLCVIKSTDYGYCFSCANHGNHVRHPNSVRYAGGHVMRTLMPFSGPKMMPEYCDDDLEADEARFRRTLEGCDLSRPAIFPGSVAKVYIGTPSMEWRALQDGGGG